MSEPLALIPIPARRPDRKLDVVFVHGLGDNDVDAWRQKNAPSTFWPSWLAEEFADIQVWTLRYPAAKFWFDGAAMALPDRATSILNYLSSCELGQRDLLFITHSLGGLVVKKLLQVSKTHKVARFERVAAATRGVVFLATPHAGADLASVVTFFGLASKATAGLKANDSWLRDLNDWYRDNARTYGWETRAFCETLPMGVVPFRKLVVTCDGADPHVEGIRVVPVDDADHVGLSKPTTKNAPVYKTVKALIADVLAAYQPGARDIIVQFGLQTTLPNFRGLVRRFLQAYLGTPDSPIPFGGRSVQLDELNRWLRDPSASANLLITAPAGRGKTALLVRWLSEMELAYPVVFVPISIRYETNRAEVFYSAVAVGLAGILEQTLRTPAADPASFYRDKVVEYLDLFWEKHQPCLLVIDGLDEAAGWQVDTSVLPRDPAPGLRIVASARLVAGDYDPSGWLRRLGWSARRTQTLEVPVLDRAGVADVIERMGFPLRSLAVPSEVIAELARLTEGEPILLQLYVERLLEQDHQVDHLRPADLHTLKPGFEGFFESWWEQQRKAWHQDKLRVDQQAIEAMLAVLACARGSLRLSELADLTREIHHREQSSRDALQPIRRFVMGDGNEIGYSLSHPKLADYFREQYFGNGEIIRRTQAGFVDWGRRVVDELRQGTRSAEKTPEYLLFYYVAHLSEARAYPAAFMTLVEDGWRRAWYAYEGGDRGFSNDVARILEYLCEAEAADRSGRSGDAIPSQYLGEQIRCALCVASIRNIGSNVPGKLLAQAVEVKVLRDQQALNLIALHVSDKHRADCLRAIAGTVSKPSLPAVLAVARDIGDELSRAQVLIALTPHLPPELQEDVGAEALAAARDIGDELSRAQVLIALAPHLPSDLQQEVAAEALAAARDIGDDARRVVALSLLAPYLPSDLQQEVAAEALAAARDIGDDARRAVALSALAPHLPSELQQDALVAARDIGDESLRAQVLSVMAPHLPPELQQDALAAAGDIGDESWRAVALSLLAPHLPSDLQQDALAAAGDIGDDVSRAKALSALAPHLPPELREGVVAEAFAAARDIGDDVSRAKALSALAPHLPPELRREVVAQALAAARDIGDGFSRAHVLSALAPHLPPELRREVVAEALAAARDIGDGFSRAHVLSALAPHLPPELRREVVAEAHAAARDIGDESLRALALSALAPHLPPELQQDALAAARDIGDGFSRALALSALPPYLPPELQQEVAAEALAAARDIGDGFSRALALSALPPYLPPELQQEVVAEALAAARDIGDDTRRVVALSALASHLPSELQQEVVAEALAAGRDIGDGSSRAEALSALAPHLPSELQQDALAAARDIGDEARRAEALSALAPHLTGNLQSEAVRAWTDVASRLRRSTALETLADLLPAICPETLPKIYKAIRDIGRWWP